jgi:hypothetical protein
VTSANNNIIKITSSAVLTFFRYWLKVGHHPFFSTSSEMARCSSSVIMLEPSRMLNQLSSSSAGTSRPSSFSIELR